VSIASFKTLISLQHIIDMAVLSRIMFQQYIFPYTNLLHLYF